MKLPLLFTFAICVPPVYAADPFIPAPLQLEQPRPQPVPLLSVSRDTRVSILSNAIGPSFDSLDALVPKYLIKRTRESRLEPVSPIAKTDLIFPLLEKRSASIQERYDKSGDVIATFGEWGANPALSLALLFPHFRFATIRWVERANPKAKVTPLGLAGELELTVVVDTRTRRIVFESGGSGNVEMFGKLLSKNEIRIRDFENARMVWEAFCELHHVDRNPQRHAYKWPVIKVSDTQWHLGDYIWHLPGGTRGRHHYVQVLLDGRQVVQSVSRHVEEVPDRKPE